jgi:hypothetical protein
MDNPKYAKLTRSELSVLDGETTPIPVCDDASWRLAQRLHRSNANLRLGSIEGLSITRGEINQTVYRRFITKDPTHARLLKGAEVGPYRIRSELSQGEVEWFDEERFRKSHEIPPQVGARRIATQRITGVDERRRIVAVMANSGWFFADSTNSVAVSETCQFVPEYILGLLNSKLFQWRFKITSTNNNVGTNELSGLPIRQIQRDDKDDVESYHLVVSSVKSALRSGVKIEESVSERARQSAEGQLAESLQAIDTEVAKLYGLSDNEVQLVESASIVPEPTPVGEAMWAVPL